MPQRTDATIAFSITDNLSQSIVGMKNSLNGFKRDAQGLQQQLDLLQNTRLQLKNVDLRQAKNQVEQMRRALEELGDAATDADRAAAQADFDEAVQHYNNVQNQLSLVSRQARQTEKDLLNATGAIQSLDNRAGTAGGKSVLSALGTAGLGQMAGDAAQEIANVLIGSTFGDAGGSLVSSGLSGAISGAAMGSLLGPIGTAVGAAIGGGLGLLQGGAQVFQGQDEAFKGYYAGLYEQGQTAAEESLTAGSATAAQRELDAIAFTRLLGSEAAGEKYLSDLRNLAAETPFEYADLTSMSRALATGFGSDPDRMIELMRAVGDAGSAVGASASDMEWMSRALARMQSTDLAQLGEINMFQDRGVDVIGMLSDAFGISEGDARSMITHGDLGGREAVDIIQAGLERIYGGAMETMAETFSGLTSTLEDTMTEIDNARGEGYNAERSQGLRAEIDAYGGALGEAVERLNTIAGQNEAYLENLSEQYTREALSAVLLGRGTSGIFDQEQQEALAGMREEYLAASEAYESGSQEAGLKMDSLRQQAEALATAAYESSEQYQMVQDTELDLIGAIRENTAALEGWRNDYELQQEQSKGQGLGGLLSGGSTGRSEEERKYQRWRSGGYYDVETKTWKRYASGLRRVPYDDYAALLHEGERVLTAREARQADQGAGRTITVNIGGTWQVRAEEDVDAIAEAIYRQIELAERAGVR